MSRRYSAFLPPFRVGPNHVRPQFDGRCSKLKTFACTFAYSAPETRPLAGATYVRESCTRERMTASHRVMNSCSIDRFLSRMSGSDRSIVSIRSSTNLPTRSYFFSFYKYLSFNRSIFRVSRKLTNNRRDCYYINNRVSFAADCSLIDRGLERAASRN